jgi:hypothetical protein
MSWRIDPASQWRIKQGRIDTNRPICLTSGTVVCDPEPGKGKLGSDGMYFAKRDRSLIGAAVTAAGTGLARRDDS